MTGDKTSLVSREAALPGRSTPITTAERHVVLGTALKAPLTTTLLNHIALEPASRDGAA